jgi:hypothetical protein
MKPKFKKEDLMKVSPFKELAERETYAKHYDTIVNYIQMGRNLPPAEVVGMLYKKSCYYAGISATWRTILFCFAQGVLNDNDDLERAEDVDEMGVYVPEHYERFYPEYKGQYEKFELSLLDPAEEWFYTFKMWHNGFVPKELKPAFFYGMYCNFKRTTELFDFVDEEFMETLTELEEDE